MVLSTQHPVSGMAAFIIAGEVLVLIMALARLCFIVPGCWYVVHEVCHGVFRRKHRVYALYFIGMLYDVVVKIGTFNGQRFQPFYQKIC